MGEACFQNGRRRNSPAAFDGLQMPDTFLPTIFLSRLHLFLRLMNVHLPELTQKGFFICNLEIVWAGICRRGRDNCELPRQVSRRKQYSQTPFWAVLTWISAGIKHSCFLGIMLMLTSRPIYTHLSYIISIRKWRRFLFPMIMLMLMLLPVYIAYVYACAYAYVAV